VTLNRGVKTRIFHPMSQEDPNTAVALDEKTAARNPIELFQCWLDDAVAAKLALAEGMTLATATADGRPSARVVLLKQVDEAGFVFYTNYRSQKGRELDANPIAELVFWWAPLERQVRINGKVVKVSAAESDQYFQTRPRESQIGAIASPQSEVISSRYVLEEQYDELEQLYHGRTVTRPEHWGGYRLKPERIEFWKGRAGRLHARLVYEIQPDGAWTIKRLAP
jgi:pyridoxamine 5'-phosphate oxidase